MRGLIDAAWQSRTLASLPLAAKREVLALFTLSAREFLDRWFESDPVKAAFGFDATVGNYASPDAPGSAYVLLHHVFGQVNGNKGSWGHVVGGMGAITQAVAAAATDAGAAIVCKAPVERVLVEHGKAVGLRLASAEDIRAKRVIANLGPRPLFDRLVPREAVPEDFARARGACG